MDVVQSLRVWKTDRVVRCKPGLLLDLNNAADEIEALRSTIRALSKGDIVPISDKDAEIDRLREALRKIAEDDYTREDERATFSQPTMIWQGVALRALEQSQGGSE